MTLLTPRRALVAGLALVASLAMLPGAASARPLAHSDGPGCQPITPDQLGAPFKTSLPYILEHGFQFGFSCDGIYKGGVEYRYEPQAPGSGGGDEGDGRAVAASADPAINPDTTWPTSAKYTLKAKVTMPSSVRRALGLSSSVAASGTLTGPKPYDDHANSTETDAWTLTLSPAFKAALKRKKVAYVSLSYTLDVTLPAITAYADSSTGKALTADFPETTAHLGSGDSDFKFIKDSAWTPKCKTIGKDIATGCPGA